MTKAVSNREIRFIKAVLLLCEHDHFFLNVENGVYPSPLQTEKKVWKSEERARKDGQKDKVNPKRKSKNSELIKAFDYCLVKNGYTPEWMKDWTSEWVSEGLIG